MLKPYFQFYKKIWKLYYRRRRLPPLLKDSFRNVLLKQICNPSFCMLKKVENWKWDKCVRIRFYQVGNTDGCTWRAQGQTMWRQAGNGNVWTPLKGFPPSLFLIPSYRLETSLISAWNIGIKVLADVFLNS